MMFKATKRELQSVLVDFRGTFRGISEEFQCDSRGDRGGIPLTEASEMNLKRYETSKMLQKSLDTFWNVADSPKDVLNCFWDRS